MAEQLREKQHRDIALEHALLLAGDSDGAALASIQAQPLDPGLGAG